MKNYFNTFLAIAILFTSFAVQAQKKRTTAKRTSNIVSVKATERNFGSPSSISDITDISEADPAYSSLKNLIATYGVTLTYADNTFRGKEPLRRGDFIVAFNSALETLGKAKEAGGIDSTVINTYDVKRGGAYLTSIGQVKDLKEGSIYYPAAKSLIERWGIAAPFTLGKTLSANSTMTEKEVYDILRATLGYSSSGSNPYTTAMSRNKFAIVLNNAVSQKMSEINTLRSALQTSRDEERRRQMDSINRAEAARKDSIAKEIQQRKLEAERQEQEARKKLNKK